jgi:L-ascorbate metabolism protein UlaG (beta-lactamase superfamily)
VPVLTTPQAAARLRRRGVSAVGLDTWQRHELHHGDERLTIEALPAVHARGSLRSLLPPVMGSLLEYRVGGAEPTRVYLSGDTLAGAHLDAIAARHPSIDVAVVHLGGMRLLGATVTLDGAGGVELLQRVRPHLAVPVHYDDYGMFASPLSDFEDRVRAAGLADRVRVVRRGETVPLAWP